MVFVTNVFWLFFLILIKEVQPEYMFQFVDETSCGYSVKSLALSTVNDCFSLCVTTMNCTKLSYYQSYCQLYSDGGPSTCSSIYQLVQSQGDECKCAQLETLQTSAERIQELKDWFSSTPVATSSVPTTSTSTPTTSTQLASTTAVGPYYYNTTFSQELKSCANASIYRYNINGQFTYGSLNNSNVDRSLLYFRNCGAVLHSYCSFYEKTFSADATHIIPTSNPSNDFYCSNIPCSYSLLAIHEYKNTAGTQYLYLDIDETPPNGYTATGDICHYMSQQIYS